VAAVADAYRDRPGAGPHAEVASAARRVVARVADLPAAGVCGGTVGSFGGSGSRPVTVLYDRVTGAPLALVESAPLVALAAFAVTVVAASVLADPASDTVGVLGTGPQARNQVRAACHAFPVTRVTLWSPTAEHRDRAAADLAGELGVDVAPARSPEEAAGSRLVMAAARSAHPVLLGGWLGPGTHVTSVGADRAGRRELDATAVDLADRIVVDGLEQARSASGDLIGAAADGVDRWGDVVELADVLSGAAPGRTMDDQVTVFAAVGPAVTLLALAAAAVGAAVQAGAGRDVGG
jgi:alanine dehydrogenase